MLPRKQNVIIHLDNLESRNSLVGNSSLPSLSPMLNDRSLTVIAQGSFATYSQQKETQAKTILPINVTGKSAASLIPDYMARLAKNRENRQLLKNKGQQQDIQIKQKEIHKQKKRENTVRAHYKRKQLYAVSVPCLKLQRLKNFISTNSEQQPTIQTGQVGMSKRGKLQLDTLHNLTNRNSSQQQEGRFLSHEIIVKPPGVVCQSQRNINVPSEIFKQNQFNKISHSNKGRISRNNKGVVRTMQTQPKVSTDSIHGSIYWQYLQMQNNNNNNSKSSQVLLDLQNNTTQRQLVSEEDTTQQSSAVFDQEQLIIKDAAMNLRDKNGKQSNNNNNDNNILIIPQTKEDVEMLHLLTQQDGIHYNHDIAYDSTETAAAAAYGKSIGNTATKQQKKLIFSQIAARPESEILKEQFIPGFEKKDDQNKISSINMYSKEYGGSSSMKILNSKAQLMTVQKSPSQTAQITPRNNYFSQQYMQSRQRQLQATKTNNLPPQHGSSKSAHQLFEQSLINKKMNYSNLFNTQSAATLSKQHSQNFHLGEAKDAFAFKERTTLLEPKLDLNIVAPSVNISSKRQQKPEESHGQSSALVSSVEDQHIAPLSTSTLLRQVSTQYHAQEQQILYEQHLQHQKMQIKKQNQKIQGQLADKLKRGQWNSHKVLLVDGGQLNRKDAVVVVGQHLIPPSKQSGVKMLHKMETFRVKSKVKIGGQQKPITISSSGGTDLGAAASIVNMLNQRSTTRTIVYNRNHSLAENKQEYENDENNNVSNTFHSIQRRRNKSLMSRQSNLQESNMKSDHNSQRTGLRSNSIMSQRLQERKDKSMKSQFTVIDFNEAPGQATEALSPRISQVLELPTSESKPMHSPQRHKLALLSSQESINLDLPLTQQSPQQNQIKKKIIINTHYYDTCASRLQETAIFGEGQGGNDQFYEDHSHMLMKFEDNVSTQQGQQQSQQILLKCQPVFTTVPNEVSKSYMKAYMQSIQHGSKGLLLQSPAKQQEMCNDQEQLTVFQISDSVVRNKRQEVVKKREYQNENIAGFMNLEANRTNLNTKISRRTSSNLDMNQIVKKDFLKNMNYLTKIRDSKINEDKRKQTQRIEKFVKVFKDKLTDKNNLNQKPTMSSSTKEELNQAMADKIKLLPNSGRLYRLQPQPFADLSPSDSETLQSQLVKQNFLQSNKSSLADVLHQIREIKRLNSFSKQAIPFFGRSHSQLQFEGSLPFENDSGSQVAQTTRNNLQRNEPKQSSQEAFRETIRTNLAEAKKKMRKNKNGLTKLKDFNPVIQELIKKQSKSSQMVSLAAGPPIRNQDLLDQPQLQRGRQASAKFAKERKQQTQKIQYKWHELQSLCCIDFNSQKLKQQYKDRKNRMKKCIKNIMDQFRLIKHENLDISPSRLLESGLYPVWPFERGPVQLFLKQVKAGNIEEVDKLLAREPLLVFQFDDIFNHTGLIWATKRNNQLMVRFLCKRFARVNQKDLNGNTALNYAVEQSNVEMVKILLCFKASPESENKLKQTITRLNKWLIIYQKDKGTFEANKEIERILRLAGEELKKQKLSAVFYKCVHAFGGKGKNQDKIIEDSDESLQEIQIQKFPKQLNLTKQQLRDRRWKHKVLSQLDPDNDLERDERLIQLH